MAQHLIRSEPELEYALGVINGPESRCSFILRYLLWSFVRPSVCQTNFNLMHAAGMYPAIQLSGGKRYSILSI